jgi:hypothetical protein
MNTREIALLCVGGLGVCGMGYMATRPTKDKTQPDAGMDAIGGFSLAAGASLFFLVVMVGIVIVGVFLLVKKAGEGDVDKNIDRSGRVIDVVNKARNRR